MAFIAGKNTLSSGTGAWTLIIPADATIAIDDPPTKNPILADGTVVPEADFALFPTIKLVFTLTADGTSTVAIAGDPSTYFPDPIDSIGFTANVEIDVINNTGHALSGLTFNLTTDTPSPFNLGSSVVHYGEAQYDANYAYFTMVQPVDGETEALFTPTGATTTAAGAAPSKLILTGNIAPGATVVSDSVIHNTERTNFNDFHLSVTDTPATVGPPPPPPPPALANILLQNTNGLLAEWQMNGIAFAGGGLVGGDPGPTWHARGTGSFYGPGSSAILWQNDDGSVALWQTNGLNVIGGGLVGNPGLAWHMGPTGDFNNDGHTDIAWQHDDGSVAIWEMNGSAFIGGGLVANPGPTWHMEGAGDFYDDGHTSILWQNDDGSVALWDMSGTSVINAGVVNGNPGPTWHIKGTGDFYGDGHTDILWQNDDGSVALWDMHGTNFVGGGGVGNPGPAWHIKGTGDFNNDNHTDIVWQNDDGSVAIWEMNGANIIGGGLVGNPSTAWNVVQDNMRFIYSTAANETLVGSAPSPDEFVFTGFAPGPHTISGFNPVQDVIEFTQAQFASFADVQAATTAAAGGAMINLGNGSSLSLPGVNPASLHVSNFALV